MAAPAAKTKAVTKKTEPRASRGYVAIRPFLDLQDNSYLYNIGDAFPRPGLQVSDKRFASLASGDNLAGQPVIKAE